jgi:hypothetical protein
MYTCGFCGKQANKGILCSCRGVFYCSKECRTSDSEDHVFSREHEIAYLVNNMFSQEKAGRIRAYVSERIEAVKSGPKRRTREGEEEGQKEEEEENREYKKPNVGKEEEEEKLAEEEKIQEIVGGVSLEHFPDEIMLNVFRFLDQGDPSNVARLARVSKKLNPIAINAFDPSYDNNRGLEIAIMYDAIDAYEAFLEGNSIKKGSRLSSLSINNNEGFDMVLKSDAVKFFLKHVDDKDVIENIKARMPPQRYEEGSQNEEEWRKVFTLGLSIQINKKNTDDVYHRYKKSIRDLSFNGNYLLMCAINTGSIEIVNDLLKDKDVLEKLKDPLSTFVMFLYGTDLGGEEGESRTLFEGVNGQKYRARSR